MGKVTLVSSSLIETFPEDGKAVLLGTWCLANPNIEITNLDSEILEYHWDKADRFYGDVEFLEQVYEEYLDKLTDILNTLHCVAYSKHYWRINLGWWLTFFIEVLYDRWQNVSKAAELYPHGEIRRIIQFDLYQAERDTSTFFEKSANDELWNERLSADIFENFTKIEVSGVNQNLKTNLSSGKIDNFSQSLAFLKRLRLIPRKIFVIISNSFLKVFLSVFYKKTLREVSLEATYLSSLNKLKLFYHLRAIPRNFTPWEIPDLPLSNDLRNWNFSENTTSEFAKVLEHFLPKHLPKCFLEGYLANKNQTDRKVANFLPEIIVTANDFAANDTWKFWASECVERGSKLIIAQHGGAYGVAAHLSTQDHEVAIADRFLSWGWKDNFESKIYPAPSMKLLGQKKYKPKRDGFCLLVTASLPRRSYHLGSWPVGPQLASYLSDQFDFVNNLSNAVRSNLAIRLFPHDFGWEQEQRWINFDSDSNLLPLSKNLDSYLKETRLFISTYNATTFLESFKSNIPTVIYWDSKFWEINDSSKPYFNLLRDANIFFDSPKTAALHVNEIWEDVQGWWNSKKVKEAVKIFSETYAYTGSAPLEELRSAILNWD